MSNTKFILDYSSILKRSSCLLSENNTDRSKNVERLIENMISDITKAQKITLLCEENAMHLFREMSNLKMATKYYDQMLTLIECYSDYRDGSSPLKVGKFVTNFINNVIPYMENLDALSEALNTRHENISNYYKDQINDAIKKYNVIDRILENHNTISKRFNIENEINKLNIKGSNSIPQKVILNNCCSMIDTYNIPCYQKMNICIEEVYYLLKKNNISTVKFSDIVKCISEYYLLNNDIITAKDMKGIKKVLNENAILNEDDTTLVSYIVKDDVTNGSVIRQCINSFLVSPEKNTELFIKTINLALDCDFIDLSNNLGELLIFITDAYYSELYDNEELDEALYKWADDLDYKLSKALESDSDINTLTKEYADSMFKQISIAYNYIKYNDIIDDNSVIKKTIDSIYHKMEELQSIVYSESNLNIIEYLNDNDILPVSLNELKISNRNNLSRTIYNVNEIAKGRIDSPLIVSSEDASNVYQFIGEDNKLDITLYMIPFTEDSDQLISELSSKLESVCFDINKHLHSDSYDTLKCYYEINPYIATIHLKDATPINLSDEDAQLVKENKFKSADFQYYINELACADAYADLYEKYDIEDELLKSISEDSDDDYSLDKFETMLEIASIIGADYSVIENYTNKYSKYRFNSLVLEGYQNQFSREELKIKNIADQYEICKEASIEDKLEALLLFEALLTDDDKLLLSLDEANIPGNNKDEGKEEKKGMRGLNKMKLYLQGLKAKFKGMSQKEKEISKKIDLSFKNLVKSMKDALISDRREAIIKGSVIPSFSKCVKIGAALAGIAKFGHPEIAAIGAIGGLIASKKLTKKERIILLDELEVELDVIDKEINNAESRGQMKKYRALMQQKKSLQRQYDRIRFNIKTGRDLAPNSELGLKKMDKD